ncbi:MAG: MFS transporter, partial [Ktedonobacterales bacterium]|nr:MFS transporter [Ktedonobacterales bacterium]
MQGETPRLPRGPLVTLALGNFAIGMGSLVIAGIIKLIAAEMHVSVGAVGQLVTVYALTYAIASPLLVLSVGHLPRRTLLVVGLAGVLVGNVVGALAPTFGVLVVARVIAALGAALFTPLATGVAAALSPPAQRGQAIGLVFGGLTVATAFGVPLGTVLGQQFGWRMTFVVVAVISAAGMLAIGRAIAANVTTPPVNLAAWGSVLRQSGLLLAVGVTLVQSTAQFVVFTYITPFLGQGLGLAASGITWLLLGFGVASILGNFAAAQTGDRWGARRTVLVTLGLLAAALTVLSLTAGTLGA